MDWTRRFLRLEASAGIILIIAATLAIIIDNTPLTVYYEGLLRLPISISIGEFGLSKPLLLWINDGLMAIFFMLVGLEIKREVIEGNLSSLNQISLPAMAALGGMIIPALIYYGINRDFAPGLNGWAIPAATDIAFALGILSLLGPRIPTSLKVFLTALAIIDDLGAILIIALFYTANLSALSLWLAAGTIAVLVVLNRLRVTHTGAYILVGVLLWIFVLKSGIHATLAGVVVALAIPLRAKNEEGNSPLVALEHYLHPWVAYMILPFFAFANAGVPLADLTLEALLHPVSLGIAAGLFLGKQIGVMGFSWLAVKFGMAHLPEGSSWSQIYGISLLTGIGFTMSLFIGSLAFETGPDFSSELRIGVIIGSVLSALCGYAVLYFTKRREAAGTPEIA
ncbi:Na+/H+ antiporter NhaA [Luteithermobacter gelatinilyticus]|uniref:Na+/H+ antiporter NhaA n=1 Tax=Luteithermobacter gelatinilyticus TaxID=2582913 RepID=UPI0011071DA3|tara:strand:- start:23925 stop:25112 length:1188 start_codon:yes stop_codon:yes gene_type:complete